MKSELIEAKPYHCGRISRVLRKGHRNILVEMGVDVHREMREMFDASMYRKAWFLDGKLMAIGGVTGTAASAEGMIWLAISEDALNHRHTLARVVLRLLTEIMMTKRSLGTVVLTADKDAIKLAYFLGFRAQERTSINDAKALIMICERSLQEVA